MNRIVGKLLVPHDTEYLAINRELLIVETSSDVKSFADCPHEVIKGKDIRLGFPELVGIEDAVMDILKGRQKSFRLEGISRCSQVNFPKYIDLYITSFAIAKQVHENDSHVLLTGKTLQVIETVPTSDGCMHHWLVFKFLFRESHRRQLVGGVAVDISDRASVPEAYRILLEQELFAEKELAQVTLKSIGDAVITTDASGQIKYLNPVAEKLTGWKLQDVRRQHISQIIKIVNEVTHEALENPVESALRCGCTINAVKAKDCVLITRDGNKLPIYDSAAPIRDKSGKIVGAVMVFQDVSQQRNMARQLSWQATHDALSGLFNRREFERRLQSVLNDALSGNQQHALCYLDLDRFKIVNDTCGHLAGDELLRQVTALFQSMVRSSDTLARLGGDEFGILLCGCLFEPALAIAQTIVQKIREFRFVWQGKTFTIGVSIGLVMIDADRHSINTVLTVADAACYAAKNKGRDRVHVYQANDSEMVKVRGQMQWIAIITQDARK